MSSLIASGSFIQKMVNILFCHLDGEVSIEINSILKIPKIVSVARQEIRIIPLILPVNSKFKISMNTDHTDMNSKKDDLKARLEDLLYLAAVP